MGSSGGALNPTIRRDAERNPKHSCVLPTSAVKVRVWVTGWSARSRPVPRAERAAPHAMRRNGLQRPSTRSAAAEVALATPSPAVSVAARRVEDRCERGYGTTSPLRAREVIKVPRTEGLSLRSWRHALDRMPERPQTELSGLGSTSDRNHPHRRQGAAVTRSINELRTRTDAWDGAASIPTANPGPSERY